MSTGTSKANAPNLDATLMPGEFETNAAEAAPATAAPPPETVLGAPPQYPDEPEQSATQADHTLMPPEPPRARRSSSGTPAVSSDGTLCSDHLSAAPDQAPTQPMRARPSAHGRRAGPAVDIPGYEVLGELGRGGMGVVYKARHTQLKRLVALKMILSGAHAGAQARARFLREAEAVAKLQHPNIIQIYEIGEADGNPFFSLEFVDGGSLDGKLNGQPLHARQAAQLTLTLALAVQAAHEKNLIHRDLKPANILLARGTEQAGEGLAGLVPKITDFGLAKNTDEKDSSRTRDGEVMGTPSYMAPEQAAGNVKEIGPAADVYALGAMLYEFLTGRPPFRAATAMETVMQVINEEPVPLRQLIAKLPRDLEIICSRCLEKDVKKRYPTAQALAGDLQRFLDGEPIQARPVPLWERAWRWARKHPTAAALTAAGCVLAVALVAGLMAFNSHLQNAVAEARADEKTAREAEEEANKRHRLTNLRLQAHTHLQKGRSALAANNAFEAEVALGEALGTAESEPELADVKKEAEELRVQARSLLAGDEERRKTGEKMKKLAQQRDDALFYSSSFTGLDLPASLRAIRKAALDGLALYGIGEDGKGYQAGPAADAKQQEEIAEACYELLLILAEAVAHPLPVAPPALRKKQAEEALALLGESEKLGKTTQALHRRRARYLEQAGRPEKAEKASEQAGRMKPASVLDFFLVADDAMRRSQLADAVSNFEQALQLKPDHFWAQYFLATCQLRLQSYAAAKAHLTSCIGRRDFVWAYLLGGLANGKLGDFAAAEADYAKALERKPDALGLYGLHVNRGVIRVKQKNFEGAADDLRKAIALRPNDFQAYSNLADVLQKQGLSREALVQLNKAVELNPAMPALYRARSSLRRDLGEKVHALADLKQAAQAELASKAPSAPSIASDHVSSARLHLEAKRYSEALADCDRALKVQAGHVSAQRWKGEALLGLKRYADAADCFDRYLERGKPTAEVVRSRGLTRAKLGRHAEAVEDLTHALRLRPDAETYASRGWVHLVLQAPKLAHHDFEQAIELEPMNADAHNGRGYSAALLGQGTKAVADAETALKLAEDTPRHVYNSARIFAQVFAKDSNPEHQQRAVQLLEKALLMQPGGQRSLFWKQFVLSDPAMLVLRGHPGFARLRELNAER